MPKKRVGVSLRKPSPAPETSPESATISAAPSAALDVVASEAAVDSAPPTVVMSSDAAASERPSDIVALRETAPAPVETQAIDAFVNGAAAAFEKTASELPRARLAEVLQRGPDGYRELVLYLPEKLAQALSLHCLEHNLDISRLVTSAIEQYLNGASNSAATLPTEKRRAEDAPANEGLLSLAARALMGELAAWVRAIWRRRSTTGPLSAAVAR